MVHFWDHLGIYSREMIELDHWPHFLLPLILPAMSIPWYLYADWTDCYGYTSNIGCRLPAIPCMYTVYCRIL